MSVEIPKWLVIAMAEMGTAEVPGLTNNPRIVEYHAATTLHASDDETPWCSSFACWSMEKAGFASTKNASARSWLNWGKPITIPKFGCITIFERGLPGQGHVGFYLDQDDQNIYLLGGNQSDHVCIRIYSKTHLLGLRWPITL